MTGPHNEGLTGGGKRSASHAAIPMPDPGASALLGGESGTRPGGRRTSVASTASVRRRTTPCTFGDRWVGCGSSSGCWRRQPRSR